MIDEARRRAYLEAMQVDVWLPRVALPFAAPARPELLPEAVPVEPTPPVETLPHGRPVAGEVQTQAARTRARLALKPVEPATAAPVPLPPATPPAERVAPAEPVPRFSVQLLRAGNCLLLLDLPTGEPLQRRDPAYLLLRDLLRAARLPDNPRLVGDGEPIRWPLLATAGFDQSPAAAREYVQGVLAVEREQAGCACLWLLGAVATRFGGGTDAGEEAGIMALPGLETLLDEPLRKADVWRLLRRHMPNWMTP